LPLAAHAQASWPSQPIKSIAMFPPGAGADIRIRFYAKKLAELAKQPVVVENKPGAFGNLATEAVARAKPDGYTIYIAPTSSTHAAAPHLFKKLPFDPINDFEQITTLSRSTFILCIASSAPYKSVPELVAFLKEKGENANYATIAVPSLVAGELFKAAFGLKTVEIKYKDPAPFINELLAGHTAFFFIDHNTAGAQIKSGTIRTLSLAAARRLKSSPEIPSTAEVGIPNLDLEIWWSVSVPKGTPKPIRDQLEVWFNQIVNDPESFAFNGTTGADPFPGNAQIARDKLVTDTKLWGEYARIAKIVPQ
jgi:tripartite-type tricarboxylate transporter receptor subunit TctC